MWWIIIGAVIALVVLIVLMVIFTDKTGRLGTGLSSCAGNTGQCLPVCPENTLESTAFDCGQTGEKCCIGVKRSTT